MGRAGTSVLRGSRAFVIVARPTYPCAVASPNLVSRARTAIGERVGHLLHEVAKFGVVGLIAFTVDVGTFNVLRFHGGTGLLYEKPITAKVVSTVLATIVAYVGNRFWTFRHRDRVGYAREYLLFFLLNAVGLAIAVGCLAISHYGFNLRGPVADNVSANGVGLVLGTLFRFWAYRRWVFREIPDDEISASLRQPV